MELYNNATLALLQPDDDGGVGLNALISYTLSPNVEYRVRVKFYSSSESGQVKLSIAPCGVAGSPSDFYNIPGAYGTNATYDAALALHRVEFFVFQPSTTKSYTIQTVLSSYGQQITGTYLYVLETGATGASTKNGASNKQAKITKSLTAGKQYLIIVSAYNITTTSGNIRLQIT